MICRTMVLIGGLIVLSSSAGGLVVTESAASSEDMLRMSFVGRSANATELVVTWDRTRVRIPIVLDAGR